MLRIIYWSDYTCPYCYIGETRLKKALAMIPEGEEIILERRAFQMDPHAGKHAQADTRTRFARKYHISEEDAGRRIDEISRLGRKEGLDFNYADTRFTNTLDAHRLMKLAQDHPDPSVADRLGDALFQTYFGENRELADEEVLLEIGTRCGLDEDEIRDVLYSDRYLDQVIPDQEDASALGIHAIPFFLVGQQGIPGAVSTGDMVSIIHEALQDTSENWLM